MRKGYVGTYSSADINGIYSFDIDEATGVLSNAELLCRVKNSKYFKIHSDKIFSVCDFDSRSGVSVFNFNGNREFFLEYEDVTSCYIDVFDGNIYTANYHSGTVSELSSDKDSFYLKKQILLKEKAGCHQVLFLDGKILVPSLLLNKITIFNRDLIILDEIMFPINSGPRHCVFSEEDMMLYVVTELSDELFCFSYDGKKFNLVNRLCLFPNSTKIIGASAAIRLSEDGKKLYISTRDVNIISVVKVSKENASVISQFSSFGDHPRDILNVFNDKFLIIANKESNQIVSVDTDNFKKISCVNMPQPVCICM